MAWNYEEGHKRETRKSYQAYIEEITKPESSSDTVIVKTEPNTEEVIDDGNIRRSKRTPVPKRNFKLIDDFEKKEPPKKKEKKGRKTASVTPQKIKEEEGIEEQPTNAAVEAIDKVVLPIVVSTAVEHPTVPVVDEKEIKEEVTGPSEDVSTEDQQEEEEEVAPRKSGRVRKPKEFKDSITPAYVKKSVERSRQTSKAEGDLEADSAVPAKPENKSGRKRKMSESDKKKENEFDVSLVIKEEVFTESSQTEDSQQEDEIPTKRRKRSKGSTADTEQSVSRNQKRTSPKKGTPQIKLKIKPMAERPTEVISEETEPVSKKKDKKKKKKADKLIVSFKKKKPSSSDKRGDTETGESSQEEIEKQNTPDVKLVKEEPIFETPKKGDQVAAEPRALSTSPKKSKAKKKSKEKKKEDANQKVTDVQTFSEIKDQSIVKVKKKKIYKKKKGVKVLVRIIKNHCNKAGEIVKTETVAVDDVKGDDGGVGADKEEDGVDADTSLLPDDEEDVGDDDAVGVLPDEDKEKVEPTSAAVVKQEKVAEEDVLEKGGRGQRIKKPKNKDIYEKKKATKQQQQHSVKKAPEKRSRKGGKNVTVGGKVVGKTTKGLKRTGERPKDVDKVKTKKPCPCCTGKLLLITEPIHSTSEPKNAYNLFCRKYRPIIVANHPRADFSEISRRLAAIWKNASKEDRAVYFEVFGKMECAFRNKLGKLGRQSPSQWSETEFQYIKEAISHDLPFQVPTYPQTLLQPVDMAAHLQILGESLAAIGGALEQQSSITVHGAMSLMLDSMLCALGPLISMTSYIPEMKAVDSDDLAKTMDNISYILPGL